jgi:hypothetical protein
MALLDNLLGDSNGGLLGNLLGGGDSASQSSNSSDTGAQIATNPSLGLGVQDVLHSMSSDGGSDGDSSSFTGLGGLGLSLSAPTFVGVSHSSDTQSTSMQDSHDGGLLGGLL